MLNIHIATHILRHAHRLPDAGAARRMARRWGTPGQELPARPLRGASDVGQLDRKRAMFWIPEGIVQLRDV